MCNVVLLLSGLMLALSLPVNALAEDMLTEAQRRTATKEAVSADGSAILLAHGRKLQVFDMKSKKALSPIIIVREKFVCKLTSVAVSPDGRRIAAGHANLSDEDGGYVEYESVSGKVLKERHLGIGPNVEVKYIVQKDGTFDLDVAYDKPRGGK